MRLLRDANPRGPQQLIAEAIPAAHFARHRARGVLAALHRADSFMECGIERLAEADDGSYAVPLQQIQQVFVNRMEAL